MIRGTDDDYDIKALLKVVTTGDHRPYLALDAVSRHCISVLFANGDPDSCLIGNVLSVMNDVVLASDEWGGLNNAVEFLVLEYPIFALHSFTLKIPGREISQQLLLCLWLYDGPRLCGHCGRPFWHGSQPYWRASLSTADRFSSYAFSSEVLLRADRL